MRRIKLVLTETEQKKSRTSSQSNGIIEKKKTKKSNHQSSTREGIKRKEKKSIRDSTEVRTSACNTTSAAVKMKTRSEVKPTRGIGQIQMSARYQKSIRY